MARNRVLAALLLVSAHTLPTVHATAVDQSFFNTWMMQVMRASGARQLERLPCRAAASVACTGLARNGAKAAARKRAGKVDPFATPTHTSRSGNRQAVANTARRVLASGRKGSVLETGSQSFAIPPGFLVLSDAGRELLGVNVEAPAANPPRVDALAGYVDELQQAPPPRTLADASGGVGDSAYGALYDFDDEGGNETQRGFVEIPTVLAAPAGAIAAVPEPGTLLLLAAGLLGWRARGGLRRPARGAAGAA